MQILKAFNMTYGERLRNMKLANVERVEETFKGFAAHVRPAVRDSIIPLMETRTFMPTISLIDFVGWCE